MHDFWTYYKKFLAYWGKELWSFGGEQVVGVILAVLILIFQIKTGLVSASDRRTVALATIFWPYLALIGIYVVIHLIRTPWELHKEAEHEREKAKAELKDEIEKRGRPDVTAEFRDFGDAQWMLVLRNSSPFPAVDIHIDDIRNGDKVLRFMPPSSLVKDNAISLIGCGILRNGWTQTDNMMSLLEGDSYEAAMSPVFNLSIKFSSLDYSNRKHWIFRGVFWYDTTEMRFVLQQQTIDTMQ